MDCGIGQFSLGREIEEIFMDGQWCIVELSLVIGKSSKVVRLPSQEIPGQLQRDVALKNCGLSMQTF